MATGEVVDDAGVAYVLNLFDKGRAGLAESVRNLVAAPEPVLEGARAYLVEMAPTLAYLDDTRNALASALFYCAINLCVYKALREEDVDVHAYGVAMLKHLAGREPPGSNDGDGDDASGFSPGPGTHPGEFKVEMVDGQGKDFAFGYNIRSCAICHLYAQHDAMALVPYMCASDDVVSDQQGQGLRRSGTIALGATQCDFRYQPGGQPRRVADEYGDQIHYRRVD